MSAGVEDVDQLAACTLNQVRRWRGCGDRTLDEYRNLLTAHGLSFANSPKPTAEEIMQVAIQACHDAGLQPLTIMRRALKSG